MIKQKNALERDTRLCRHIPNLLTICNSLFGFAAILNMLRACGGNVPYATVMDACVISSWMIFSAMIFDATDGLAARLLHATSMHGIQMDSLSDMVTFGVAPATMVAILSTRVPLSLRHELLIYILCSVYLGCAALRLATYNVKAIFGPKASGNKFSGLPSPGAAAAICIVILFAHSEALDLKKVATVLPFFAAILGLLMTSSVPYVHAGKWLQSARRSRFSFLLLVVMLTALAAFRMRALAVIVILYICSGPITALFFLPFGRSRDDQ